MIVIITCGATFLVRSVEAYNYFAETPETDSSVIAAAAIKRNRSMFFIDETAVKNRVESALYNVGVVNVERKFPDKVSINYRVYSGSFQYASGGNYYQCYASGRIGSSSTAPIGGYFIIKPANATRQAAGEYFQASNGTDYVAVMQLLSYLYQTGLNDLQISERIDFVDFTRDGYYYIRTRAGCSIELKGSIGEFSMLIDDGWSAFVDPDKNLPISKASGTIRCYINHIGEEKSVRTTYSATDGDEYYLANY